jgi:hypothetical protein
MKNQQYKKGIDNKMMTANGAVRQSGPNWDPFAEYKQPVFIIRLA